MGAANAGRIEGSMTDAAAEVARIRAEFAARDARWMSLIKLRLAKGPATSAELASVCLIKSDKYHKSVFAAFLFNQKVRGQLVVVGKRIGPTGYPNNEWGLA